MAWKRPPLKGAILRGLLLVSVLPLVGANGCPKQDPPMNTSDGGAGDGGDGGVEGVLRQATFGTLTAGGFVRGTIDGITIESGPFQGIQNVLVEDAFGEGQDLAMRCGSLTIRSPELHFSFSLVFNDDGGTLIVEAFDQNGQSLTPRPIDTQVDAQAIGIMRVDNWYKRMTASVASGVPQRVESLTIGSCGGSLHEIVLQ